MDEEIKKETEFKDEPESLIPILIFLNFFSLIIFIIYIHIFHTRIHNIIIYNVLLILYSFFLILFVNKTLSNISRNN